MWFFSFIDVKNTTLDVPKYFKMKNLLVLSLSIFLYFTACTPQQKPAEETTFTVEKTSKPDSLVYQMDELERKWKGCNDDRCATYTATYIQLTDALEGSVAAKINQAIINDLRGESPSILEAADAYIADFDKEVQQEPDAPYFHNWTYEISQAVLSNDEKMFSIASNTYEYAGGAHGSYYTHYLNFNTQTGKKMTLGDVLKTDDKTVLYELGEQLFKSEYLKNGESYKEVGYSFGEEDQFYLPDNYVFEKEGIRFLYNIYEIAPYVLGQQEILFPWEKIEHLRKR